MPTLNDQSRFSFQGQGIPGGVQQTSVFISICKSRVQTSFSGDLLTNLCGLNW